MLCSLLTTGTLLAELAEHQLTIRLVAHANLSANKKYLPAASRTKRDVQARLIEPILRGASAPGKLPKQLAPHCTQIAKVSSCKPFKGMAGTTGLEPAASAVTV
jgi:hypothetical protein